MAVNGDVTLDQMNVEARVRLIDALENKGAHLSFEEAVDGFPERLMNVKPPHVPYTFWHQLEHMRRTQADMLSYIQDPKYVSPEWPRDYWPARNEETNHEGWARTIRDYLADHAAFVELVGNPELNLLAPVIHMGNRSVLRSTLIVVDHTAYHLGEFVMARQILGAWKSELE